MTEQNENTDESISSLKVSFEEDYLRQLQDVENQNYIPTGSTGVPLIDDESSTGLKRELNIEGGQKAKKNLMFDIKDVSVFRLYFHLSEPLEYLLMILGFIGSVAAGAANPVMAYLTGSTTNEASSGTQGNIDSMNDEEKKTFFAEFKKSMDKKVKEFMYYGIAAFVATFMSNFFWEYASLRQMHHLKEKYFARILMQEQGWFDQNNAYEFATKVQVQLEQIELGVGEKFGTIVECIATFVAGLIIAFFASWKLTLIILCVAPFLAISIIYMVSSMRKFIFLSRKAYETAGGVAEEVLYNIKTVVSFGHFDFEKQRFGHYIDLVHRLDTQAGCKIAIASAGLNFFYFMSYFAAIIYARTLLTKDDNDIKPGDVMTVCFSTTMAVASFGMMAPNINIIQEACIAASDYFTLLERKEQIDTSQSTYKPPRDSVKGRIEFKNIQFTYPSDENKRKILDDLNLVFEPGQKVALVGESGCGKSTTVNLIERLYEPTEGEVLLDGVNINKYDLHYLRSLIGYVQQEPVLFNSPIRDNIIFGRQELIEREFGGDTEQLIRSACKEAYAKEFIDKIPEKYDYVVGVKGSKLSGGQKQRIAIARAILCKPKILILDEATSALDNKSEKNVQRALDNISNKNVTTVIIAHRLSTIQNADVIYAIKDGKVLEKGTHEELLKLNGYYAGMVKSLMDGTDNKKDNMNKKDRHSSVYSAMSSNFENELNKSDDEIKKEKPKKKKKLISVQRGRIFSLYRNRKMLVFLASVASFFAGAVMPSAGFNLSNCINAFASGDKDKIKKRGLFHACMYIVIAVCSAGFMALKMRNFRIIGSHLACSMRKLVINKYLGMHMGFFDKEENAPGALLARLSIDTTQLHCLILIMIGDIVQTAGSVIVGFVLGLIKDYRLMLIALCFMPFIIISAVVSHYTKQGGRDSYRQINIEAGGILSECVINTKTIFSFNFQKEAVRMYLKVLDLAKKDFLRDSILKGVIIGIGIFSTFCSKATIYHFASVFIRNETLVFEDMTVCVALSVTVSIGCANGLRGLVFISKAQKSFDSIFRILDTKSEIDVSKEGNENKISAKNIKGKIEFKNVSFAYPTKPDLNVLKGISFTILPGQAAALVGYSGCGKSTIIQLLERFYDVKDGQGEILIDDINIKDYNLLELREKIGLVSQEPVLFKRNVYENILYGDLNANKDEVLEAAKRAHIEKFFDKEQMGTKEDPVSGGEKQRLAIARVFLKNPVILLLDEATSALDKESEVEVQKSLFELQKFRTSISIAHRLSTIVDSDIIFVIENGNIVEQGKHQELLDLHGKYSTLYKFSNVQ